jgi:hypothetical protein
LPFAADVRTELHTHGVDLNAVPLASGVLRQVPRPVGAAAKMRGWLHV